MKTGVLAVTVLAVACVAQSSTEQKTADVQAICQQTLNLEALDRHFHVDTMPDRKPLVIVENQFVGSNIALEKFGSRVVYLTRAQIDATRRPFFEFTKISVEADAAHVEFRYPPEGLAGSVDFRRQAGKWLVTNSKIVER